MTDSFVPLSEKIKMAVWNNMGDGQTQEIAVLKVIAEAVEGFKKEMAAKPFRSFGDIKRGLERWFGK